MTKMTQTATLRIGDIPVGVNHPPFVIAEMSGNHNQSLERALALVDAAAASGVQAVKLQTYTADTITLDITGGDFQISDRESLWDKQNLHDLYNKAHTPWEWHAPIIERARIHGLVCFSSPFDESAVDFLEELEVPAYKIASFENNHIPLIRKVASTGKPLIISTGMATISELDLAVSEARNAGCKSLILLKCTSTYPANPLNTNISTIPHMRELFGCEVGLSDHTMGVGVSAAAVAMGASVIEKHFTLCRDDGGVDSAFSLEPQELQSLAEETHRAWQALGEIKYGPTVNEKKSLIFKRSIYASSGIKKGDRLNRNNIKIVRPGNGAAPSNYDFLLGKSAARDYKAGDPIKMDDFFQG